MARLMYCEKCCDPFIMLDCDIEKLYAEGKSHEDVEVICYVCKKKERSGKSELDG